MKKPYYENDWTALYFGDCTDILPTFERNFVDLIVTDPPYGVNWQSGRRKESFEKIKNDENTDLAYLGLKCSVGVLRSWRHIYCFGRYDFTDLPLTQRAELIWDKNNFASGDLTIPWGKSHEYISFWTYAPSKAAREKGAGNLVARLRRGSVLNVQRKNASGVKLHPTEKPVSLLRQLIESSSCLGETVLDPFVGVGSTLIAAMVEGRKSIGIEIEEKYCEIAAKRIQEIEDIVDRLSGV